MKPTEDKEARLTEPELTQEFAKLNDSEKALNLPWFWGLAVSKAQIAKLEKLGYRRD